MYWAFLCYTQQDNIVIGLIIISENFMHCNSIGIMPQDFDQ